MGLWSWLTKRLYNATWRGGAWLSSYPLETIGESAAMNYAAVYQAVSMIAGDVASLPLNVFRREMNDDRQIDRNHPAYWLLNGDANELTSALTFRETLQHHALLWGNGYAAIERDGSRPSRLIPLLPDRTWMEQTDGQWIYRTTLSDGQPIPLHPDNVFHLRGLGFDGLSGYSVLTLARSSFGLALMAERHGNRYFANAAKPSVVLEVDRLLDKKVADQLLADWNSSQAGSENAGKTAIAHGGLKVKPLSMSNEDSQWLETRKFQRTEIAVWFGIPPHKLGDDSRTAYNSIEAENRAYLTMTLRRWMKKWETESDRKLLRETERRRFTHYIEHNDGAFIQGDLQTQAAVARSLVEATIISPNEARRKLNMNSRPGGDEFRNPNTSSDREKADEGQPASEPPPPPTPPPVAKLPALAAHRDLIRDRVAKMMRLESDQVTRAAKQPGRFLAFLDRFYDETFPATFSREFDGILAAVGELVPTVPEAESLAKAHAALSKSALLTVAGQASSDNLAAKVDAELAGWHGRSEETIDLVFPEIQEAA